MAYIPANIIEEIRSRFDIVEIVSMYVELKKTGKNYTGLCPFHAEKAPSFTVSPDKQIFHCFGCQSGGNLFTFIMQIEDLSFPEAVRFLGKKAGIKIEDRDFTPEEKKALILREKMQDLLNAAQKYFEELLWKDPRGKKAHDYLSARGVTDETMKLFGLGYAAESWEGLTGKIRALRLDPELAFKAGVAAKKGSRYYDYFRGRIIFPICDQHGQVAGFGGRILGPGEPKYLNSPETVLFNKSRTLYGFHLALPHIRREKEALLVEGYMDVILLHQYGFQTAVAPLGTALTEKQISLLRSRLEKITMVFDADAGGEKAALRGLKLLKNEGCQVKIAQLPPGMDPADFILKNGQDTFRRDVLDKAESLVGYQLFVVKKNFNLQQEDGRLYYWREARKILSNLTEPLERDEYMKKIAAEIGTSLEVLRGDLEKSLQGKKSMNRQKLVAEEKEKGLTLKERAEKELLAAVLQNPALCAELWKHMQPADFTPGFLQEVARAMHTLFQEQHEISVSTLLGYFSNREMHKLITEMATPTRAGEDTRAQKVMTDCLKRLRALHWAEEREKLIKSFRDRNGMEVSAGLQRILELKVREEELYRSVEGEKVDG